MNGRIDDGRGYLVYREGSGGTVEVFDIHVDTEYRRIGVGRLMLKTLLDECRERGVETVYAITRSSNVIAIQFYVEMRFRPVLLPAFYKDEPLENGKDYCDAVMFIRDLRSQV